jgi:hypothetical protein
VEDVGVGESDAFSPLHPSNIASTTNPPDKGAAVFIARSWTEKVAHHSRSFKPPRAPMVTGTDTDAGIRGLNTDFGLIRDAPTGHQTIVWFRADGDARLPVVAHVLDLQSLAAAIRV